MLIVIDESGCTGFSAGSSTHFVIGMIVFDHFEDAEYTANIINKLKQEIGFKREFPFTSSDNRKRDLFFEAIKKAKFRIRFFVVEKAVITSHHLRKHQDRFTNYCLKSLLQDGMHRIQSATVKIDGKGSRLFKKECAAYLRKNVSPNVINKIKFCNSENDILIQLADMVVSAFSRPYNNPGKADAYKWRNMIEGKIENVWKFK